MFVLPGPRAPRGRGPVGELRRGRTLRQDAAGGQHLRRTDQGHSPGVFPDPGQEIPTALALLNVQVEPRSQPCLRMLFLPSATVPTLLTPPDPLANRSPAKR